MEIQNPLEQAIIATLNYADLKKWPLTSWEIFRYLINPARINKRKEPNNINLATIEERLEALKEKGIVSTFNGFYGLTRSHFSSSIKKRVKERNKKDKLADKKIKKAKKRTYWLRYFPFVRAVFLSGSLIFGWANQKSDIDLLIVVKKNRLWSTRFLLSIFLILLRLKRSQKRIKDRLCLNHFITDQNLEIPLYSLYNANTYSRLVPLFSYPETLKKFIKSNQWLKHYLIFNFGSYFKDLRSKNFHFYHVFLQRLFELIFELAGGFLIEKLLRYWQIKRIKKDPLTRKKGGRIVANDMQIEFHPDSPEQKMIGDYNRNLKQLNLFFFKPERDSGLT